MITGEGGFVHRVMPPIDWNCGKIPEDCYDETLSISDIENKLMTAYLTDENVRRLANSDDPSDLLQAKISLEILSEIDAKAIWLLNNGVVIR